MRDSCGDVNALYLDRTKGNILVIKYILYTIVLQDVTVGGNG